MHHLLRARFCIERRRSWQAEYWISSARDLALSLACQRRGLPTSHGRGFDDLPPDVHTMFIDTFIASLARDDLLRSLGRVIDGLLREAEECRKLAAKVEQSLHELVDAWDS